MGRRRRGLDINGILLFDKPLHWSSNEAVQKLKRLFNAQKAGHTGSLDPLATGLLPVCFGQATKISAYLLDAVKGYRTTCELGKVSTTGDAEGDISSTNDIPLLNESVIDALLNRFRGPIQQQPPMYSALWHEGKRLYELARQGKVIDRPYRSVTVFKLELVAYTPTTLTLDVLCSKGTYIRSLVEDLGQALGCGAYVTKLRRTVVAPFVMPGIDMPGIDMPDCAWQTSPVYALEALSSVQPDNVLLPVDAALTQYPAVQLLPDQVQAILQGQPVTCTEALVKTMVRLYDGETFLGLGEQAAHVIQPRRLMRAVT